MPFKDQHIVMTGATGGIGAYLSQHFLAAGAQLTIISRDTTAITNTNANTQLIQADLSCPEGIAQAAQQLQKMQVDILINLAGISHFGPLEQQPSEHIAQLFHTNLIAPVELTKAVIPAMKQQRCGHIVNIGSTFGAINFAYFSTYSASKAGLKGFSEALRRELEGDHIDVTYIAPRAVKTPLNSAKILEFAKLTDMNMDCPKKVAEQIYRAIQRKDKDRYLGFPESLFVRINATLPRLIDRALRKNNHKAKNLFY